ncbi:MAG: hypothetical protein Q8868_05970 [Bacteroidota bacterium]|nr:hypothetical protein [Bacteroidota bacterium]
MSRHFNRTGMIMVLVTGLMLSCSTTKKYPQLREDELVNSRKYIGNFIDYSHTGPETLGGPNLIWIKTTLYNNFGRISAYSKKCDFTPGERIYLRRLYSTPSIYGHWEYQIENDSSICYRISEFRYENNVLVRAWF